MDKDPFSKFITVFWSKLSLKEQHILDLNLLLKLSVNFENISTSLSQ